MKCPKCKKTFGYVRLNRGEWCCRHCATITSLDQKDITEPVKELRKEEDETEKGNKEGHRRFR